MGLGLGTCIVQLRGGKKDKEAPEQAHAIMGLFANLNAESNKVRGNGLNLITKCEREGQKRHLDGSAIEPGVLSASKQRLWGHPTC